MKESEIDRKLKFLYYFLAIMIAGFSFTFSKLITVEERGNPFLIFSVVSISLVIYILIFYIATLVFKPDYLKIIKQKEKLVAFVLILMSLTILATGLWSIL